MFNFNMKTRRTRQYTKSGKRIPSTFNKTGKNNTYVNTEPTFTMTCKSRANIGGRGCTNAGCGKQCCFLSFLITDISHVAWQVDLSGARAGQSITSGTNTVGTATTLVFPYTCCQSMEHVGDSSYNFPLTMRVLAMPASGSCANSNFNGSELTIGPASFGGGVDGSGNVQQEASEVMGTSTKGAPYRNPIKGWRKTLADPSCCLVDANNVKVNQKNQPTNDVYKDMHAKFTGLTNQFKIGNISYNVPVDNLNNVCYSSIIRSGMQPKPNICCKTGKPATRCNRDPLGCIEKNNYAYDSYQYLNNKSLKSFHRSQDKFFTMYPDPNGGGNIKATLGGCCTSQAVGRGCPTIGCQNALYTKGLCRQKCQAAVTRENVTIYKPNNRKFSKQGATTSGGRLERLKLDTIRAANSKCVKGRRCKEIVSRNSTSTKTYSVPKGPYSAGNPRYTGEIYNRRHPETTCMLTHRQQPFGIPQLTSSSRRPTRSNKKPNIKPRSFGLRGNWQRGRTNPRAPGCKCSSASCPKGCSQCGYGQLAKNPGAPCCK